MKWQEPKAAHWRYQGTQDGFHYFHFVDLPLGHTERYRVATSEIPVSQPFPLTTDQRKWRSLPWGPALVVETRNTGVAYDICRPVAPPLTRD